MAQRDFRSWDFDTISLPKWWKMAIVLAVILALGYLVRPVFHGIVMVFYKSPLLIMFFLALIAFFISRYIFKNKEVQYARNDTARYMRTRRVSQAVSVVLIICIIATILLSLYNGYYMDRTLYENTDYTEVDLLPDTQYIRFLPYSVAQRYSYDVFTDPQYTLGDGDLVLEGESIFWKFPMVPEGSLLYFTKKPQGVISISADTSAKEVVSTFNDMEVGENIGITDNITWKIYKQDMFCDIADIYYQDDLIIVSVIKYRFKLIGRYPYFGGVYTIDYDGNIEFFSPDEASGMEWGARIYPESLARKQVEVVNTKNGILNMWIYHKEMIEVQDVYSGGNTQPFLLSTEEGLVWMTAVEPRGQSFGLYEIYFHDASTGELHKYSVSNENLTGPRYSVDYVEKTFPNFDWNTFYISEPRPIVKDNVLFWLVSIVPNDSAGVTRQCIVNAKTSEVLAFDTDEALLDFFEKGTITPPGGPTSLDELRDRIEDLEDLVGQLMALLEQLEAETDE